MSRSSGLDTQPEPRPENAGLGILSFTPARLRNRAMTIEDFSISSVEGSKPSYQSEEYAMREDWETVTWVFSDILQSLLAKEKENLPVVLTKGQQLIKMLVDHPNLKHEIVLENVMLRILFMLYDAKPLLRLTAYRILRHVLAGRETVAQLVQLKLLVNITLSFLTQTPEIEKLEALKLVRAIADIPEGASHLSVGVIKALVVLIEHEGDESSSPSALELRPLKTSSYSLLNGSPASLLCKMCVETLCELLLLNPELVFQGGGVRLLINLIVSALSEVSATCVLTLLSVLDLPQARILLRGGSDLDSLFSVFDMFEDDDSLGTAHESAKLHKRAMDMAFLLSVLMKTWTGILFFCHDDLSGFKLLLMNLKKKNSRLRSIIMDLLMDVLRLKVVPWLESSKLGSIIKRFTLFMENNHLNNTSTTFEYIQLATRTTEGNILAHHRGLILKILINCNIRQLLLVILNEEKDQAIIDQATFLLTKIYEMAVDYLPPEFYRDSLLGSADEPISINAITQIQSTTYAQMPNIPKSKRTVIRSHVREMAQEHRINLNDSAFKGLLTTSKTLHMKEFIDWNWTSLSQLFQGPIRNPQRFAEIQEKAPKLLKTFFSFLRPFKYRFGQIPLQYSPKYPTLKNPKIVIYVASQLIESLLTFDEGTQYLASTKLMAQLAEILAQVDPFSGITSDDPILSELRLTSTLSIGYVKFLGILSGSWNGIGILEQWQLLHLMNDIVESSATIETNNHLIFNLLNNLNYSLDSPVRLLLAKAMDVSNLRIKLFVLNQVLPPLISKSETELFVIDILVSLLCDENHDVVTLAIEALFDFYIVNENTSKMDVLVDSQPSVLVLEKNRHGSELLLHFCKTSKGFNYLKRLGYIDQKFNDCVKQLRTFEYLDQMENTIQQVFYPYLELSQRTKDLRHFFHYLASTEEGCAFFKHHLQLLDSILQTIRNLSVKLGIIEGETIPKLIKSPIASSMTLQSLNTTDSEDGREYADVFQDEDGSFHQSRSDINIRLNESSLEANADSAADERDYQLKQLKQNMWILGEIASAEYGFQLLDPSYSIFITEKHIAEVIVTMFNTASHWQFRGLAFFLLGMMAATEEGVEILDELNWVSVNSTTNTSISLAYPATMQNGFFLSEKTSILSFDDELILRLQNNLYVDEDINFESNQEMDNKVLTLINHLSSILGRIERKAREELTKLKTEHPLVFDNANLFLKVVNLVEKGSFKYRIRVFVFGLFDSLAILEDLVKRKRKNSFMKRQP